MLARKRFSGACERLELSGPVERLSSNVNGGIKHLPLRYRLA
jgi:hypothetical protein